MAVEILNDAGKPVGPDEVGELAILGPWPGMTRGFWRDRERYLDTYWRRFAGVWVHGDWAARDHDGFWYILGRSDDTIKVAGKRLGPAEVESALVSHPAVREAAAIGVPHAVKGEVVVAFVVLHPGAAATAELEAELQDVVANQLGKALRPERVHVVEDLPRTRNAKIVRRAVKARYLGQDPGDTSAIENLEALAAIDRVRPR
jgi:acetyl-CoA synthetase